MARITAAGTVVWYLLDYQNSVIGIVDSTGSSLGSITYDGFGNVLTNTTGVSGDRYGFISREWDSSMSLQYNRARYYDPNLGKWTSADPIGFVAGDANLYRYVSNSTTTHLDPSGTHDDKPPFVKALLSPFQGSTADGTPITGGSISGTIGKPTKPGESRQLEGGFNGAIGRGTKPDGTPVTGFSGALHLGAGGSILNISGSGERNIVNGKPVTTTHVQGYFTFPVGHGFAQLVGGPEGYGGNWINPYDGPFGHGTVFLSGQGSLTAASGTLSSGFTYLNTVSGIDVAVATGSSGTFSFGGPVYGAYIAVTFSLPPILGFPTHFTVSYSWGKPTSSAILGAGSAIPPNYQLGTGWNQGFQTK